MELKLYLKILMKRWWIILLATAFTMIITYLLVSRQPWIYEATTTYVIRPRSSFAENEEEFVKAVDTLSRRIEINTTFAEVAGSDLIKTKAIEALGLTKEDSQGLKATSRLIAGTNVLEIRGRGLNPPVVHDFTEAISVETAAYVGRLYEVFELEQLDKASVPKKPVAPNKTLSLAIGSALGFFLGIALVFLLEYLKEPVKISTVSTSSTLESASDIVDNETGAFNEHYFMARTRQALSLSKHTSLPLSLVLIKISRNDSMNWSSHPTVTVLRQIRVALRKNLRDEDILAYYNRATFAILLPGVPGEIAKGLLKDLRAKTGLQFTGQSQNNKWQNLYGSIGITSYENSNITESEFLAQAAYALRIADSTSPDKISLFISNEDDHSDTYEATGDSQRALGSGIQQVVLLEHPAK